MDGNSSCQEGEDGESLEIKLVQKSAMAWGTRGISLTIKLVTLPERVSRPARKIMDDEEEIVSKRQSKQFKQQPPSTTNSEGLRYLWAGPLCILANWGELL